MFGLGPTELLIVIFLVLMIFGGPVLTFLVGFALGKRSADASAEPLPANQSPVPVPETETQSQPVPAESPKEPAADE